MNLAAQILVSDDRSDRRQLRLPGTLRDAAGMPRDVIVRDLSTTGFSAELPTGLPIGAQIRLGTTALRVTDAHVVWTDGLRHGFEFDQAISEQDVFAATHADNVVRPSFPLFAGVAPIDSETGSNEAHEKYPGVVRLAIILGSAGLCWAAILSLIL